MFFLFFHFYFFSFSGKQENKLDPIEFKASVFAHSYQKKKESLLRKALRLVGGIESGKNKIAFLNFSFVQSHKLYLLVTQLRDRIRYWLFFLLPQNTFFAMFY